MGQGVTLHAGDLTGRVNLTSNGVVIAIRDVPGTYQLNRSPKTMDQKQMRFFPQILPVLVDSEVQFPNSEDVLYHNVYSNSASKSFDLGTYRAGTIKSLTFQETGVVEIMCRIHTRMYAAIIVLENPYFTVVNKNGDYRIESIPAGKYTVDIYKLGHYKVDRQQQEIEIAYEGEYILNLE